MQVILWSHTEIDHEVSESLLNEQPAEADNQGARETSGPEAKATVIANDRPDTKRPSPALGPNDPRWPVGLRLNCGTTPPQLEVSATLDNKAKGAAPGVHQKPPQERSSRSFWKC
ncbi:hypothetical protein CC1G_13630 [Coprinopsis cinerea okayama7|uniref:Uncharacterized protein n=1 Tax=Coprinopsis cinerea (strain Okayama-7 / 130 / ATCC MYA-4618 / FGSC 9003) TaxID=240176 RepID=D6RK08_COPC7|nr:hypothetical protein CC1G_13630 [Coprinopsis cinerea okayama7\|eukprot:XP_002912098.1 hypothetical protein CC1G_13630 [Coprinopsis cinerea okayama7\